MNIERTMTLRARLRADTKAAHVALDDLVGGFDLADAEGLRGFLTMQALAFRGLGRISQKARTAGLIRDLERAVHLDLETLGHKRPEGAELPEITAPVEGLAVDYLVAGSRLGSTVLRKRWGAATHPQVKAADRYFGGPDHLEHWRAFVSRAEKVPGLGPEADRVVADAVDLFSFQSACAKQAQRTEDLCNGC